MALTLTPVTHATAKAFIWKHHRHNIPSITAVFCIGLANSDGLCGVAMAGLPKARLLAKNGDTLEVTRVATDGTKNANSMLYGACARAAAALGWKRLVTYTLPEESGVSLKAAGWRRDEELVGGGLWAREFRADHGITDLFGNQRLPQGPKVRWWKDLR